MCAYCCILYGVDPSPLKDIVFLGKRKIRNARNPREHLYSTPNPAIPSRRSHRKCVVQKSLVGAYSDMSTEEEWPWTMGGWPFFMVRLDGPTFIVRFLNKSIHKFFGPLTRCKLNVDWEESSCTKKWMWWFLKHMSKKDSFENNSSLTIFLVLSCLRLHVPPKKEKTIHQNFVITIVFLYHDPWLTPS